MTINNQTDHLSINMITIMKLLIIVAGLMVSGCAITDKVKKIGHRFEQNSIKEAYLTIDNRVLVRYQAKTCKDVEDSFVLFGGGPHHYECGEPYYVDSLWKMTDKLRESRTEDKYIKCKLLINEYGILERAPDMVIDYDLFDKSTQFNFVYDSNGGLYKYVCDYDGPLFVIDHSWAAKIFIKNGNGYSMHYFPYPEPQHVDNTYLVAVRYFLMPIAFLGDIATAPIQFLFLPYAVGGPGR